jgi:hypothetical protein
MLAMSMVRSRGVLLVALGAAICAIGVATAPARALTYGESCGEAEGSEAVSAELTPLPSPANGATVLVGTPVAFSGESGQALTFNVASSPALLSNPDIDSGPGSLQAGTSLYTFTSTRATATARTIYWDASFTFTPEYCEKPSIFKTVVHTLTVVSPPPKEEAPAKKTQEEPAVASVSLDGASVKMQSARRVAIKLTCTGTGACSGNLVLTVEEPVRKAKKTHPTTPRTRILGTATFSIAAGDTTTVGVTLDETARALLAAAHGHLNATLTIVKTSPTPSETQVHAVHLERARNP